MTPPATIAAYDVRRENAAYERQFGSDLVTILADGQLVLGNHVEAFETQFAAFCGTRHCVGVGNGLDALSLALQALGIGPGDDVVVPAFTFIATWFSVSRLGARPVPVDVLDDGTMDPGRPRAAMTARTRAIIPVHLFGRLADMAAIIEIAGDVPVVEDAAQAHGATRDGRRAGAFGVMAAFSFYPTKNLGALGDGGGVTCDDDQLARRVRALANYGSERKYRHEMVGQNSRLDALQARFLSTKLPELDRRNACRSRIAGQYLAALGTLPGLACPSPGADDMVWHQFVLRTPCRDRLQAALLDDGVGTAIHYPVAPFDQPCYAGLYDRKLCPVASRLAATVLSLPMAAYLSGAEVARVIAAVRAALTAQPAAEQARLSRSIPR